MNPPNSSAPPSVLEQADTLRAIIARLSAPSDPLSNRRYHNTDQKTQQVPTVIVPAELVLQPPFVEIRHRPFSELMAQRSSQPLSLPSIVHRPCPALWLPQIHCFAEQFTQSLPEAMPSTPIGVRPLPTLVSTTLHFYSEFMCNAVFSHGQRQFGFPVATARADLRARVPAVYPDKLRSVEFGLILQHRDEVAHALRPRWPC